MELDLPSAETAELVEKTETRKLTVNIPQAGSLFLGSQPVSAEQLREQLVRWHTEWGDRAEVRIRTNQGVAWENISPTLVLAAQCGIWNVSFAVTEKRPQ